MEPAAAVLDSRMLRNTPESGQRAGYDGHERKKGSKLHMAALDGGHGSSHLIALHVTPASTDDRTRVGKLAEAVQAATGNKPAVAAEKRGIKLEVGKRTPSAASCCCRGAGWWSAPLPGSPASAASRTTKATQVRSPACTSSPSSASC